MNLEPDEPPPYPVGLPVGGQFGSLEDLDAAQDADKVAFVVYLCLRRWMYSSPPIAGAFDAPDEARAAGSAWAREWRMANLGAHIPLGALLDEEDLRRLLVWREDDLKNGIRAMLLQTVKEQGYPYPELVAQASLWPSLSALDDIEMLCVEWVAEQNARHRSVFQSAGALTRICPMGKREAIQLIHTWRAVMALAMKRTKDEARAEAELQMLAAAQHIDAGPSLKASTTKNIASMYGLGKEEKTQSLEGQLMDLLTQGADGGDEPKQLS